MDQDFWTKHINEEYEIIVNKFNISWGIKFKLFVL